MRTTAYSTKCGRTIVAPSGYHGAPLYAQVSTANYALLFGANLGVGLLNRRFVVVGSLLLFG
jgi:hypothetical protein